MKKKINLLVLFICLSFIAEGQVNFKEFCKKTFKFSTFYAAASGGTSLSDEDIYNITSGSLQESVVETPYDFNLAFGVRKLQDLAMKIELILFMTGQNNLGLMPLQ